jgi:hypothetical protein
MWLNHLGIALRVRLVGRNAISGIEPQLKKYSASRVACEESPLRCILKKGLDISQFSPLEELSQGGY